MPLICLKSNQSMAELAIRAQCCRLQQQHTGGTEQSTTTGTQPPVSSFAALTALISEQNVTSWTGNITGFDGR